MKLFVATGNDHKAREMGAILEGMAEVRSLKDIGFKNEIVESGRTFHANAEIKLRALAEFLRAHGGSERFCVLADDSGMEVDFLGGAPGVISARYAGEPSNDEANNQKLLAALKEVPGHERTAQFKCVLAATVFEPKTVGVGSTATEVGEPLFFEGICPGKIGFFPKGTRGFGYDPIFFPDGFCKTYAELTPEEKNKISHRAKALREFKKWFQTKLR